MALDNFDSVSVGCLLVAVETIRGEEVYTLDGSSRLKVVEALVCWRKNKEDRDVSIFLLKR